MINATTSTRFEESREVRNTVFERKGFTLGQTGRLMNQCNSCCSKRPFVAVMIACRRDRDRRGCNGYFRLADSAGRFRGSVRPATYCFGGRRGLTLLFLRRGKETLHAQTMLVRWSSSPDWGSRRRNRLSGPACSVQRAGWRQLQDGREGAHSLLGVLWSCVELGLG